MNWNLFQWRSIRTRVTLFTLLVFLSGLWSLALYSSWMLQEDMQRLLGEQQFSTVSLIADKVNEELDSRLGALEKVAGAITPVMLDKPGTLQGLMEQRQVLQTVFNGGAFATRLDGTAIASVPLSVNRSGINYLDSDAIVTALKDGRSTIGRPVMGKALTAPVFVMAVPIHDAKGKVIGALAGVTNLSSANFLDKFTGSSYGKTGGYLLIAPQHNLFITGTDKSRVMKALPPPGINRMHDRYMQGFDGFGVAISSRGVEELSAAKHIRAAGWFIVAVLPTDEAFAPIRAMQLRRMDAILVLTLLAGALTWWATHWMLGRQLSPMLAIAKTLATWSDANHPPQTLPVTTDDEIGELIGSFNRLVESAQERETALRENEAKFRSLAESSTDIIIRYDRECRHTYMNPAALKRAGLRAEQIIGKTHRESGFSEHLSNMFEERIRRVFVTAKPDQTEFKWKDADGLHFLDWQLIPQLGADGEVLSLWGISRDITDRKLTEIAREEALDRLQKIASRVPGVVFQFRMRADGTPSIPYTSEAIRDIYRLSPDEVREDASRAFAVVHPDDAQRHRDSIDESAKNLTPWNQEYRLKFEGEPDIWLLGNAIPQREEGGSILWHGFIMDITKRKQAEEQFRIAAAAFESQQAMAVTDTEGVILQINRAFTEVTGYSAEEIVGKTPQLLMSLLQHKDFYSRMLDTLKSVGEWKGEVSAQRKNDQIYTQRLAISAVKNDDGVVTHYIWAHTDITERKREQNRIKAMAFYGDYI